MCWGIKFMNSSWLKFLELRFTPSLLDPNFLLNTREIIFASLSDGYQSHSVKTKNFHYSQISLSVTFSLHVKGFREFRPKETGCTYTIMAAILWGDTAQKQVQCLHNVKISTSPGANLKLISAQRKVKICKHTALKSGLLKRTAHGWDFLLWPALFDTSMGQPRVFLTYLSLLFLDFILVHFVMRSYVYIT